MPGVKSELSHSTETLWGEFRNRLKGFILRRVRQGADADDILQDVFLRLQQNAGSLKDPDALTGWIFRITRNAIVDHYRTEQRRPASITPDMEQDLEAPPETEQERLECLSCLRPMILELPGPYREALVLTELEGLSQIEAAARTGLSVPGMKSRVQRARRQLKDLFLACCTVEWTSQGSQVDCSRKAGDHPAGRVFQKCCNRE
jgi:RNA polymerase sigma-70 factor (ECF subfamily)